MNLSLSLLQLSSFLLLWLGPFRLAAQEVPPFRYYNAQEYRASAQNWKITYDQEGTLFFANNDGVVVAEAGHWSLLPSVNKSIVRSVLFDDGRLYVGMYMEFGYYERNHFGRYEYTSLSRRSDSLIVDDEQFWNIFRIGHQIIFQSLDQLIIYLPDQRSISVIKPPLPILQGFVSRQRLFIQDVRKHVHELINGSWQPVASSSDLQDAQIALVTARADGILEVVDEWGVVYQRQSESWIKVRDLGLRDAHIYSAAVLNDQGFVLGTISDGIRVYDQFWNLRYSLGSDNGIRNNTVLSLQQDAMSNIWLGLDNGLMCINHEAPLSGYVDQDNDLGTIYAAVRNGDFEYLGTNIGLFYRRISGRERFRLMTGSSGQVWNLQVLSGRLMMGHHKGSFEVEGDRLMSAGGTTGTWKFVELEPGKTLIAGTYRGIDLLQFKDGRWRQVHKLSGFSLSSRHLESVDAHTWLVSHEYKGVFELEADEDWTEIKSVRMLPGFVQGIYSSLAGFDGKVWYFGPAGLFSYDGAKKLFERHVGADAVLDSAGYYSGKMVPLAGDALCFFRSGSVVTMRREVTDDAYRFDVFPAAIHLLKPMRGFENISSWGSRFLLGGVNQYFLLQPEVPDVRFGSPRVFGCTASSSNGSPIDISLKDGKVPSTFRTVAIRFGTAFHQAYQEMQYQFRLLGLTEKWSPLNSVEEVTFNDLPSGNYVFQVRSAAAVGQVSAITEFPILIERHPALRPGMIFLYILGLILLVFAIHRSYTGYYRRQRRKLMEENEKSIRLNQLTLEQDYAREKNQFLEAQVGQKKKELAQTMVHLNKNVELLSEVRDYLSRFPGEEHLRLLQKIEGNLADEDSWTLLETAFRQVDSEFLNKLRQRYPDLSPSELKLCVYLRLNLSSKEISTLLNISAKSVEIKRYRLRKKMGLDAHVSLQSFVLGL